MNITYFGHSAFLLETKNCRILTDPYLLENPLYQGTLEEVGHLDYIFISHGHFDHLGDAKSLQKLTGAIVVSNPEIVGYLETGTGIQPSGWIPFPFGRVKAVNALHTSGIPSENGTLYGGQPFGYVFELEGKRIYFAGDTGLISDMALLKPLSIDIAMLPIGGFYTMDLEDAVKAVDMICPKAVIPMHYNTFPAIETNVTDFQPKSAEVLLIKPMETVEI